MARVRNSTSFNEAHRHRVAIGYTVICFDRSNDGECDIDHRQKEESYEANNNECQDEANNHPNGHGYLEVECFFGLFGCEWQCVFLDLPNDQWGDEVGEWDANPAEEGREVCKHGPVILFF